LPHGVRPEDVWRQRPRSQESIAAALRHRARRVDGIGSEHPRGDVRVIWIAAVAEQVEEHDAGKTHPVFRGALQLGLILFVHLVGEQFAGLRPSGPRDAAIGPLLDDGIAGGGFVGRRSRRLCRAACAGVGLRVSWRRVEISARPAMVCCCSCAPFPSVRGPGIEVSPQGRVHAGVLSGRGVGIEHSASNPALAARQGKRHQQPPDAKPANTGEFHVTPRATEFECPDMCRV